MRPGDAGPRAWSAVVVAPRRATGRGRRRGGGTRERLTEQPEGDDDARVGVAKEGDEARSVQGPRRGRRARHRKEARGCGGPAHRRDPLAGCWWVVKGLTARRLPVLQRRIGRPSLSLYLLSALAKTTVVVCAVRRQVATGNMGWAQVMVVVMVVKGGRPAGHLVWLHAGEAWRSSPEDGRFHATNRAPAQASPASRPYQTPGPRATRLERACGSPCYRGYGGTTPLRGRSSGP